MKKTLLFLPLLLASFLLQSFSDKETHTLKVTVNSLRNSKGVVLFLLYNKDGSIPDKKLTKYYKKLTGTITSGSSSITFENIPQGKYAIAIIHDENINGKIDKVFFLPKEGIGFSNYQSINLRNRPNFSKASFYMDSNLNLKIKTIYM